MAFSFASLPRMSHQRRRRCTLIFPDGTELNIEQEMRGVSTGHTLEIDGDRYTVQRVTRCIERKTYARKGAPAAWVRVNIHIAPA